MDSSVGRTDAVLDEYAREMARLRMLEPEYKLTLKVLAVVTERLLMATGGAHVVISDEALAETPDLLAWREDAEKQVIITVAR